MSISMFHYFKTSLSIIISVWPTFLTFTGKIIRQTRQLEIHEFWLNLMLFVKEVA